MGLSRHKYFFKNFKYFCGKKTFLIVPGFEPGSFDCRSTALSKASLLPQKGFKLYKKFEFNLHLFAIWEFEIVYEDTCRQCILSDEYE